MSVHIDEFKSIYDNVVCVGERTYSMVLFEDIEVRLKMTGESREISIWTMREPGYYGFDTLVIEFSLFSYTIDCRKKLARLTVYISEVDLIEKKLDVKLSARGSGSLFYPGLKRRLISIKHDTDIGYAIHSTLIRIVKSIDSLEVVNGLLCTGCWKKLSPTVRGDCVLFDLEYLGYARLVTNSKDIVGYVLKQGVTYFLTVDNEKEGYDMLSFCIFHGDTISIRDADVSILNKRLL